MLVHTTLSTQTLSHAWNPQTIHQYPLPPLRTPQRYSATTTTTRLQLSTEFNDINIDDVLMEAEFALQAAETSLSAPPKEDSEEPTELQVLAKSVDALAGTMGGIVLGGLLGTLTYSQVPDLDLLVSPVILPILFAFVLGTLGFASGFVTTPTATAIQNLLATPTKAVLSGLGLLALQQVERGANEVKAIPSKISSGINQKVEQDIQTIQAIPSKVVTATKDKVSDIQTEALETLEKNRNVLIGATVAVVAVPIVLYIASNSEQLGTVAVN